MDARERAVNRREEGNIFGMHDYTESRYREIMTSLRFDGLEKTLANLQENPLPSIDEYYDNIQPENNSLRSQVEYARSYQKDRVAKLEELIPKINTAKTEEELKMLAEQMLALSK